MANKLEITWKKSCISTPKDQRATVEALGLHRLGQTVVHEDNSVIRGMVNKLCHLLDVREIN